MGNPRVHYGERADCFDGGVVGAETVRRPGLGEPHAMGEHDRLHAIAGAQLLQDA